MAQLFVGQEFVLRNLRRRIQAFNENHEPAGSPEGGEFAPSSGGSVKKAPDTAAVLKQLGWKKDATVGPDQALYKHPTHGTITQSKTSGKFMHWDTSGHPVKEGKTGPGGGIKQYVKQLAQKAASIVSPWGGPPVTEGPKPSVTEQKPPSNTSATDPEGKAFPEVHKLLTDYGFSWKSYSPISKQAIYKHPNGQVVYIDKGDSFTQYPPGFTTDPVPTKEGAGLSELKEALEKSTPTTPSTPTVIPFPDPEGTSEDPKDIVDLVPGQSYTAAERSTVHNYKLNSLGFNDVALSLAKKGTSVVSKVENLDNALAKGRTRQNTIVWRGLSGDYAEKLKQNLFPGFAFTPEFFQEASTSQSAAENFAPGSGGLVLKIRAQAGTPAIPTTALSASHLQEQGIIFGRNVYYKVNKVYQSHNKTYADVNLIHPGVTIASASGSDYVQLVRSAAALKFSVDQLNQALTTITDSAGRDVTPAPFKLLRLQLDNYSRKNK